MMKLIWDVVLALFGTGCVVAALSSGGLHGHPNVAVFYGVMVGVLWLMVPVNWIINEYSKLTREMLDLLREWSA